MKMMASIFTPALLLGAAVSGCSNSNGSDAPSATTNPSANWTQVSDYLNQSLTDKQLTGYTFMAFNASSTLFQQAGGDQTMDSVEPIASASKLPSTAAILTLVDQGKLDLDTPVSTYLQGNIVWPPEKSAITMRMLLSHTSGLPDDTSSNEPECMSNRNTTMLICAQEIAAAPLSYPPGTNFDYGGVDFQLAGYIATVISGQDSWQAFFNNAIATPLQLTTFTYDPSGTTDADTPNPLIGGGASSNAADYVTFLRMIMAGGAFNNQQILQATDITQIERNEITDNINVANNPLPTNQYPGYGMGVFIEAPSLYTGSPGQEYSDPGLFGTFPWFDLGLDYGAILLIVDTATTGVDVANALRPLVIDTVSGTSN